MLDDSLVRKDRDDTRRERQATIISIIANNQPIHYNRIRDISEVEFKIPRKIFDSIMVQLRKNKLLIETKVGKKLYFTVPNSVTPINREKFFYLASTSNKAIDNFLEILARTYPKMQFEEKARVTYDILTGLLQQSLTAYLLSLAPSTDSKDYQAISEALNERIKKLVSIIFSDKDCDNVYCFIMLNMRLNNGARKDDVMETLKRLLSTQRFKNLQ